MQQNNKHGQAIGRKGAESRRRLLDATRRLIATESAHRLTASAIARAAGLASQTFYLYFTDIDEALLALTTEAGDDIADVHAALDAPADPSDPVTHSRRFVDAYSAHWDRHRDVLTVRNYLADSGNARFVEARAAVAMPIVRAIADRISAANGGHGLSGRVALSRAVIIFSAIERMAARPLTMTHEPRLLDESDLKQAEADILGMLFTPDT